jgi:hypothetical protein
MHRGDGSSMSWWNPARTAVHIGGGLRWSGRDLPARREREEGEERPNRRQNARDGGAHRVRQMAMTLRPKSGVGKGSLVAERG